MIWNERGLTLAEILVAAAIIGIGLVGLLIVVPISTYGVQEGKQASTATFLAEQRLEQVRNATWAATPTTASNQDPDCLGVGSAAAPTSTACVRAAPTACTDNTACTTFPDEANVTGYTGYGRIVRVVDCGIGAGCGTGALAVIDANLRLVTVTVSYRPLTGQGVAAANKTVTLQLLVAKRI